MVRILLRFIAFVLFAAVLSLILLRLAAVQRETGDETNAPLHGRMIETASLTFHTQSNGPAQAQPVLLAHGTAAWSGFWEKEVTLLGNAGYRAIAFDMPPFGYSDRAADGDYTRATQAQRILDLVDTLARPPILVAHSFGAAAATEAVLINPQAFAGLIIVDGALAMEAEPNQTRLPLPIRPLLLREATVAATVTNPLATKFLLRGLLYNKDAANDAYIEILQEPQNRRGTTSAYAEWLPALLAPQTDSLSRNPAAYVDLPIPVRIIWGDQDTITPPAQAETLAAALGQSDVTYLKDVGHIPHIEAPEAFMDVLLELLTEISQAR